MEGVRTASLDTIDFIEFMKLSSELGAVDSCTAERLLEFARLFGGVGRVPWFQNIPDGNRMKLEEALLSYLPQTMNFGNFVVSSSNRFAFETARTMALMKWTWEAISPLFIFGGTGLGKTHLLSAISRTFAGDWVYLDTADLTIQLQYSTESSMRSQLKNWILKHDMLLLDDLHLSRGDPDLQKLLHSVLGCAIMQGMAVVVACSSHPTLLGELDESLVSRAASGTVASMGMPDLQGRMELLGRLFHREGIALESEVERIIAEKASLSVRQLTSAGRSLIAEALSMGGPLTADRAEEVLASLGITGTPNNAEAPEPLLQEPLPAVPVTPDGTADGTSVSRLREMIGNADSMEQLCEALAQAVRMRMDEISSEGLPDDSGEMMMEAVAYLDKRDLYSAMECFDRIDIFQCY